jgi:D-alanyl-D-alanine carboxypeptidase/D-alanyl-D-alanine-endopeptidase (penicillin-binding protein 4)
MSRRPHLSSMATTALLAAALLGAFALGRSEGTVSAQPAAHPALATALAGVVSAAGMGDQVSIAVVDATSGTTIFTHHADLALNPASNMKLVTAAAALATLGADFRIHTGLYGHVEGDAVTGGLVLRGFGDPTLRQADLVELARDLADHGVRTVDRVIVDGTYFDGQYLPPAFDQQPGEVAAFRATTAAVSVDANAYTLRVLPGASAGALARVRLDGAGYFDLDNQLTTSEGGAASVIADQRALPDTRMHLGLRGTIPLGITGASYRRRIENPLPWAGAVMVDALSAAGIRTAGGASVASAAPTAGLLADHVSPPLSQMILAMGKQSDNFTAEMLFRVLGAERRRPGSAAGSAEAVSAFLTSTGIAEGHVTVVNGSGLFQGNRIAAGDLAHLLAWVYQSPAVRDEYVASLAIGGVDGTLERRLRDLPAPRIVRAKTGTLDDAIALSGYVLGRSAGETIAFSVLVNGARGRQGPARALCDDVARAIANELWQSDAAH